MIKRIGVIALVVLALCAVGCERNKKTMQTESEIQTEINAKTYTIPESYFMFTNTSVEETKDYLENDGKIFCEDVKINGADLELTLTNEQKENLISRNNHAIEKYKKKILEFNDLYEVSYDMAKNELTICFDETFLQSPTGIGEIYAMAVSYGYNYMLENNTSNWSMRINFFNCNTDKLVKSFVIPDENTTIGPEDWNQSR